MSNTNVPQAPEARELTPEEAKARAELCQRLDQDVRRSVRAGREAMWDLARSLYEFHEQSGWSALGYVHLNDWLADSGVDLTYGFYNRLVTTWREFVAVRGVDVAALQGLAPTTVNMVLPALRAGEVTVEQALEDAKLPQSAVAEKYRTERKHRNEQEAVQLTREVLNVDPRFSQSDRVRAAYKAAERAIERGDGREVAVHAIKQAGGPPRRRKPTSAEVGEVIDPPTPRVDFTISAAVRSLERVAEVDAIDSSLAEQVDKLAEIVERLRARLAHAEAA